MQRMSEGSSASDEEIKTYDKNIYHICIRAFFLELFMSCEGKYYT